MEIEIHYLIINIILTWITVPVLMLFLPFLFLLSTCINSLNSANVNVALNLISSCYYLCMQYLPIERPTYRHQDEYLVHAILPYLYTVDLIFLRCFEPLLGIYYRKLIERIGFVVPCWAKTSFLPLFSFVWQADFAHK